MSKNVHLTGTIQEIIERPDRKGFLLINFQAVSKPEDQDGAGLGAAVSVKKRNNFTPRVGDEISLNIPEYDENNREEFRRNLFADGITIHRNGRRYHYKYSL